MSNFPLPWGRGGNNNNLERVTPGGAGMNNKCLPGGSYRNMRRCIIEVNPKGLGQELTLCLSFASP